MATTKLQIAATAGRFIFTWKGLLTVLTALFIVVNVFPLWDSIKKSADENSLTPITTELASEFANSQYNLHIESQKIIDDKGFKTNKNPDTFFGKVYFWLKYVHRWLKFFFVALVAFTLFRVLYAIALYINDSNKIGMATIAAAGAILLLFVGNLAIIDTGHIPEGQKNITTVQKGNPFIGFFTFIDALSMLDEPVYVQGEGSASDSDNQQNVTKGLAL